MHSKQAFTEMIQANQALIYKVTRLYARSREDEEDLYQEIVYQLWKSYGGFRREAKPSTWMYRIALNTAIAYLNQQSRRGSRVPFTGAMLNSPETSDTLKEEQVQQLYGYLKQLDTVEKGIMLLYLEGKTYDEMAAVTGFTVTNIGTRLSRIRQKLITKLKK